MIVFGADITIVPASSPVVLLVHCDGTNGSTTFIDKSPSAHSLTPTSVTVATGNPKFGTGSANYTFSNLASSISVGGNASDFWFDAGPFTMEAWCYATQAPGWDGYSLLFSEWGGALSNLGFWFSAFPTIMFFWSFDGVTYGYVDAGVGCPLNAWTHIAADRDASGTLRVYLNGSVVASQSIPGSFFHSTFTCQIGNDNTLSRPFPGYLDEIRVTKGVAQYGGAFTPPTAAFPDPGAPSTVDLAGGLAPTLTFAADLTVSSGVVNYVDFTGNIGDVSSYGLLAYGLGLYSRIGAFAPVFSGNLDIVGQDFFAGNLAPIVTFAGVLTFDDELVGDLAPQITFAANLGLVIDLAGDLSPQVALGASLSLDLPLTATDGSFGFTVVLEASEMISGPLWAGSTPCPPTMWTDSTPCPPTMWTPTDPCDPVEWEESELCNG